MMVVARRRCVVQGARGGASGVGLKCGAAVAAAAAAAAAVAVAAEAAVPAAVVRAQALLLVLCGARVAAATMSQSVARATYMQVR